MGWWCPFCSREHDTTGCPGWCPDSGWTNDLVDRTHRNPSEFRPIDSPEWPSILNNPPIDYAALKEAIKSGVKEALDEHRKKVDEERQDRMARALGAWF